MDTFYQNIHSVVEFLKLSGVSEATIRRHKNCYSRLNRGLSAANVPFSRQAVSRWFDEFQKSHSFKYSKAVGLYIERLFDVYETGEIRREHISIPSPKQEPLPEPFHRILDEYIADCTARFSPGYLPSIKSSCTRFLRYVSGHNIRTISGITYELLADFRKEDVYRKDSDTLVYQARVMGFLAWLADKGKCAHGLSKYIRYAHLGKILPVDGIPDRQRETMENLRAESMDFPTEELPELINGFLVILRGHGYSEISLNRYESALWQLYLFLDMNSLGYHPDIADAWVEARIQDSDARSDQIRRAVLLFRQFIEDNGIRPQVVFRKAGTLARSVPGWCAQALEEFLAGKEKEGLASRTIMTYRCACAHFCVFLGNQGLERFSDVTAGHVKQFNLVDKHRTPGSKNLYNGKIRQFLMYLADRGLLTNPGLFLALSRKAAGYERVVVTLTDAELNGISRYAAAVDGPIGIRDRAILELGIRMGMRASDIVNLKMDNIDWKDACIRFVQKKTSREAFLPMPVSVGNALYLYITQARPKSGFPYIFLKSRAPYTKLAEQACERALKRALPDRDIPGSAFHVTRKTFSTALLKGGCRPDSIIDLMGHSDGQSLVRYLGLDEDGMRRCPLSLKEAGVTLEGGVFHV